MGNQGDFTYFKNLDGLRAIAAFSVIFFHCGWWFNYPDSTFYKGLKFLLVFGGEGGHLGVKFFFVLSGFLITYLMFSEQAKRGKLNVPYFYVRRILRIWPLYYLTLLVGFLIYPWLMHLAGKDFTETASGFLYSVFAANFDNIYNGYPKSGILGVQWSVAVEEQFYVLWPLVFFAFSRKKLFPFLLLAIIVFSETFYFYADTFEEKTFHLFSCFRFLAFGGLLAWLCFQKSQGVTNFFRRINKYSTAAIYITGILLLLFQRKLLLVFPGWYPYVNQFTPLLFFGFVIAEQNYSPNSFFKIGSFRILNWLGKISYGLYLTHMIAIYIVIAVFPHTGNYVLLKILCTVLITVLISHVSYYYIESFFLSLKNKFSIIKTSGPQAG